MRRIFFFSAAILLSACPLFAAVAPDGTIHYGDLFATNADRERFQTYTDSSNTFGGQTNSTYPASPVGDIQWVVAKASPTRNEQIIAFAQDTTTADLYVLRCTGNCDAAGDFSEEWSNAGVEPALTCDGSDGGCVRAYDVGYEQLSGDALVVYGDNASAVSGSTSKVYYCVWNGSAWSPSGCAPSDGSNDLPAITNFNGTPTWVRVIPMGEQLTKNRSDRILVLVGTDAVDVGAWIWNGSNFTSLSSTVIVNNIGATTPTLNQTQFFDGAWETESGDAVVLFGNSATSDTTPAAYKVYSSSGNTWDGSESAIPAVPTSCIGNSTTNYVTRWAEMASSPGSDKIVAVLGLSASTGGTSPMAVPYDWSGSAWAVAGGSGASINCEPHKHSTMHTVDVAWEKYNNGTEAAMTIWPAAGTGLQFWYQFYSGGSWDAGGTVEAFSSTDDSSMIFLYPAANAGASGADRIHALASDIDCNKPYHRRWTGSAWDGGDPTVSGALPPDCNNAWAESQSFTWVNKMYSARQRNWRWTNGQTDTASTPTTFLAAEITRPKVGNTTGADYRLRVQIEELTNGASATDSRKKLQYVSASTCADPDNCSSWTDVDDPGGAAIWRYVDLTCTATDCADNTVLTGTVLTGTNGTCSAGNGCGTWVLDKDAAAGTNMDHNASIAQEIEYDIENNGAAANTIYYFRLFDVQDNSVIYREYASDCGASSNAACTYPSIDTSAALKKGAIIIVQ